MRLFKVITFTIIALTIFIYTGSSKTYGAFADEKLTLADQTVLREQSASHIAIASINDRLYIAWTGIDDTSTLNLAYSLDGRNFPDNQKMTLQESSGAAPSLTTYKGELVLLWSNGGTQRIEILHSPQTSKARRYNLGNNETRGTVTGFNFMDSLAVAWRGEDEHNRPNIIISPDGKNFPQNSKKILKEDSSLYHLGGVQFKDMILIAFTGVDQEKRLNLRYSNDQGKTWQKAPRINNFSRSGPSLLVHNNKLIIAFTGINGNLNLIQSTDGLNFNQQTIFRDQESSHSPQLAVFNKKVYITWKGNDSRIRIARIKGL